MKKNNVLQNFKKIIDSNIFKEQLLNESQESTSIRKSKKYLMQTYQLSEEEADKTVREKVRVTYPMLRSKIGGKFIYGVTRIQCEDIENIKDAVTLGKIINYIIKHNDLYQEYDQNLNGLNFTELTAKFIDQINQEKAKLRNNSNQISTESNHILIPINDIDELNDFAEYTPWCICSQKTSWSQYPKFMKTVNDIKEQYLKYKENPEEFQQAFAKNQPIEKCKAAISIVLKRLSVDFNKIPVNEYICRAQYKLNISSDYISLFKMFFKNTNNKLFIIANPNYKEIKKSNTPVMNDEYGISLIAVIAEPLDDGTYDIISTTSRYNGTINDDAHAAFNEYELSQLLGMPFQKAVQKALKSGPFLIPIN